MDLENKIKKIIGYKTWSVEKKVDELLRIDHELYMGIGIDSTKKEVSENKKKSRKIYRAIAQISPLDGYILEAHMMEKELVV
jgi:hypothetical protein|tara:strand:- start:208 stop:453 length:246 start_codon:yes stop_codon:yes gene_type:complete